MANGEDAWENITPIKIKKIPMLGEIAAGEPIMMCEELSPCLVSADDCRRVDFCLCTTKVFVVKPLRMSRCRK
jgi:hypothetical protein